ATAVGARGQAAVGRAAGLVKPGGADLPLDRRDGGFRHRVVAVRRVGVALHVGAARGGITLGAEIVEVHSGSWLEADRCGLAALPILPGKPTIPEKGRARVPRPRRVQRVCSHAVSGSAWRANEGGPRRRFRPARESLKPLVNGWKRKRPHPCLLPK